MHYLNGYLLSKTYTVDASGSAGAALVTGYDFLTDQANALAGTLQQYGFDPERFSEENKRNRQAFSYFPFGGGGHRCLGESFAEFTRRHEVKQLQEMFSE